jgi:hypothetical protein
LTSIYHPDPKSALHLEFGEQVTSALNSRNWAMPSQIPEDALHLESQQVAAASSRKYDAKDTKPCCDSSNMFNRRDSLNVSFGACDILVSGLTFK